MKPQTELLVLTVMALAAACITTYAMLHEHHRAIKAESQRDEYRSAALQTVSTVSQVMSDFSHSSPTDDHGLPLMEPGTVVIAVDLEKRRVTGWKNLSTFSANAFMASAEFVFPRDSQEFTIKFVARPTAATTEAISNQLDKELEQSSPIAPPSGLVVHSVPNSATTNQP